MFHATRRRFFGMMGVTPLAAKEAFDAGIGHAVGISTNGIGNASLGLSYGSFDGNGKAAVPYEGRIISTANYIKLFGLPDVIDFELRDRARCMGHLDPDIACKRSWSMSVKIMTQRQRNYDREVARIHRSGWRQSGLQKLKTLLGFDWPH